MTTHPFPEKSRDSALNASKIIGMASILPSIKVNNDQISKKMARPLPQSLIMRMLGVETRYVAPPDMADSDLLAIAAKNCLHQAGITIEQVSKLFVNKFLGDRLLPPTASILQKKLGSANAIQCMDIDGGTNSFLQAFLMAAKCIRSGDEYILIVSGGLCHNYISNQDPRVSYLFGDGATAILLGKSDASHILSHYEFSNYEYADLFKAIEFIRIANIEQQRLAHNRECHDLYKMGNWKAAHDYILQAASQTVKVLLRDANCTFDEISRFLITENNRPLWESIIEKLQIPKEKTLGLLKHQGHTLSANLPMLLVASEKQNPLQPSRKMLLLSIGEGICGGGCIYQA